MTDASRPATAAALPALAVFAARGDQPRRRDAGGASAALAVALACDLVDQVAQRSADWPEHRGALAQADVLRARALALARQVALAYHDLVEKLDEAVAGRGRPRTRPDLGPSLAAAADLLLEIGEVAADTAELALITARCGDTVVRADAAAAAVLAAAGAEVAAHLVEVNLLSLDAHERTDRARQLAAAAGASRAGALAVR